MKRNWMIAGVLGAAAALIYLISMADYAFPGTSAHLMAAWRGLNPSEDVGYPLMKAFAKIFGYGNLIAPVSGAVAVMLVYAIISFFIRGASVSPTVKPHAGRISRVGGVAAAVIFMLTPGVRAAATHLEPRMFDAMWALGVLALLIPYLNSDRSAWVYPPLFGVLLALGFCDSALFVAVGPLVVMGIVAIELKHEKKPYLPLTLFALMFLIAFFVAIRAFDVELTPLLRRSSKELKDYFKIQGWIFVLAFSTVPFVVSIFSSIRAFNDKPGVVQWIFHGVMSVVAVLAIATPLSPSSQLVGQGVYPVMSSAYAAMVAGYLAAYWWLHRRHPVGATSGIVFAFVLVFSSGWDLFAFDGERGAFADATARKIIDDLGERTWLITDGTLDDHLLLAAQASDHKLNLVSFQRNEDRAYIEELRKTVERENLGGAANRELQLTLSRLGVYPFVQHWFDSDDRIVSEVAIYSAPDLWYSADLEPVPEFLFFGGDRKRFPADLTGEWDRFREMLDVGSDGWHSYAIDECRDPVEKLRRSIRRHLGQTTNNRGVFLQGPAKGRDKFDERDDKAFDLYERVLTDIDPDNISSLINEYEMMLRGYPRATAKRRELERTLKDIENSGRRYPSILISLVYGYIRSAEIVGKDLGKMLKLGAPRDTLAFLNRAEEFIPDAKHTVVLNMMASLYAADGDREKSRSRYLEVLEQNRDDHDALIGMMRLSLLDGDQAGALEFLERANKVSDAESRSAKIELAMVATMKNDLAGAKDILEQLLDKDMKDAQAWGLLAAVTIQQHDAAKDPAVKASLVKDLGERILPGIEGSSTDEFACYVQMTKAFILQCQGEEKRTEARDAFAAISQKFSNVAVAREKTLELDIQLNDPQSAEAHALEALRKNRRSPMANYVMGSIALGREQYGDAEIFLKRAVKASGTNVLALNDLAELFRRTDRPDEAEKTIRAAIEIAPNYYILYDTLSSILMKKAASGDDVEVLDEAEKSIRRALELSKTENGGVEDIRLYMSLARVQIRRGDKQGARSSVRRVEAKSADLTEFERRELEEVKKSAK